MSLASGIRLGSYEIEAPLGAGGMGEVYKARDTRLDRTVAIKVLPAHLSENEELRQRFEREARAISSLNHPNICTLHDVGRDNGIDFLVMEYLEGETLAERLKRGPLPLDEALRVARQVSRALDAAHRQGVVHRDLKPGNIMLTKPGVKLLDFGLAKTTASTNTDLSAAPTAQKPLTEEGAILGTFQYMAPEQLEGGDVGRAADMFAFGAMLYEMVTGEKAFIGKSQASLIAAIMEREPKPVSEVKPTSPASLERLIQSCLRKDPDERWESARDLERELSWIETEAVPVTKALVAAPARAAPWLVVGVALLGLIAALLWNFQRDEPLAPTRVTINLPAGQRLVYRSNVPIALSPDGRRLVYAAESDDGDRQLHVRELSSFVATPIPGTEGAHTPFFSPDGQWLGFVTDSELKKMPLSGGAPTVLAPVQPNAAGGSWGHDGFIYYSPSAATGTTLMRISAGGGAPERISGVMVVPPTEAQLLPDGETVLVNGRSSTGGVDIGLLDLDSKEIRALDVGSEGSYGALYMRAGYLLFSTQERSVYAVRFDAKEHAVKSDAVPVVSVPVMSIGRPFLSVSDNGTLAYVSGERENRSVVRVDRRGQSTPIVAARAHAPRLSPDGRRLAFDDGGDIWVYDLEREAMSRLTTDRRNAIAAWTPDGTRIAFASSADDDASRNIFWVRWDGGEEPELLTDGEYPLAVESFSPDGRYVALTETHPDSGLNIVILPLGEARIDFLVTPANELGAQFSPDGRFIAYVSGESGQNEVYVRPFPVAAARWQISAHGGSAPVWSRNGEELFYRAGIAMMSVPVELAAAEPFGRPETLFDGNYLVDNSGHPGYAVDLSGESFYLSALNYGESLTQIHIVLNWFDELERLVPAE